MTASERWALGMRLAMARDAALLTQGEVAALAGISRLTVNRIERGRQPPRTRTLRRVASALRVEPTWLATGKGPMWTGGHQP